MKIKDDRYVECAKWRLAIGDRLATTIIALWQHSEGIGTRVGDIKFSGCETNMPMRNSWFEFRLDFIWFARKELNYTFDLEQTMWECFHRDGRTKVRPQIVIVV